MLLAELLGQHLGQREPGTEMVWLVVFLGSCGCLVLLWGFAMPTVFPVAH